jgi:MOSC domain-containing protein YiiM
MQIEHLYISKAAGFEMIEVAEVRCIAGRGIEGDRFFDFKKDYKGQITFFAAEIYHELCAALDVWDKSPAVFRRNVITGGVDLNQLIGKQFEIQGVAFQGIAECTPCYWMDHAFAPDAEKGLKDHGGLRAKILSTGTLRVTRDAPTLSSTNLAAS